MSSGIIAPALALDGADLGLCEDSANFWQNDFLMTIPLSGHSENNRIFTRELWCLGELEPPTPAFSGVLADRARRRLLQ